MNKFFFCLVGLLHLALNCIQEPEMFRFFKSCSIEQLNDAISFNKEQFESGFQYHAQEIETKAKACNCHLYGVVENYICLAEIYLNLYNKNYKKSESLVFAQHFYRLARVNSHNLSLHACTVERLKFLDQIFKK